MAVDQYNEQFPDIGKDAILIKGETVSKSNLWWTAVTIVDYKGAKKLIVYSWMNQGGNWRTKQHYTMAKFIWPKIKDTVDKYMSEMPSPTWKGRGNDIQQPQQSQQPQQDEGFVPQA